MTTTTQQPLTVKDLRDQGYIDARQTFARGYTSRKIKDLDNQPVHQSPKTKEYYYYKPCYCSTQYTIRQYMRQITN
jgi:hypothetical protein